MLQMYIHSATYANYLCVVLYIYVHRDMFLCNRVRISSNCVELIFGKGHLSTLGVSRDAVFRFFFLSDVSTLGVFFSDSPFPKMFLCVYCK